MTVEAKIAKQNAVNFECKKDALRQVQDGGVKVTFTINPDDMPSSLYADPMGQRYMLALVALNDDETPVEREKPKSFAGQAKMMIQDDAFCDWCAMKMGVSTPLDQMEAEKLLKRSCNINSCAELIEGADSTKRFKILQREYLQWKNN